MQALLWPALILPWLLIAALTWFLFQMFRQYGERLLDVERLRAQLDASQQPPAPAPAPAAPPPPPALDLGSPAPAFALPDSTGRIRSLGDYLGRPTLLVFFNPGCGFCEQMAPRLAEIPADGPQVVLVSRGDRATHERWAADHGWTCDVLFEESWAVANSYLANGTPMGYLVDAEGRIASGLATGAEALLALGKSVAPANGNGLTAESLREKQTAAVERARAAGVAVKDIGESRIGRDGLKAGTKAPLFSLPDLDGRQRSLKRMLGKKPTLLVFSDVNCGPCQALAPDLVQLNDNGVRVVMVSRGDAEANRQKAAEHGLDFPVLLQRSWEVSKEYAMFATPVGYLIDEQGVIAEDVAVGSNAILALAGRAGSGKISAAQHV